MRNIGQVAALFVDEIAVRQRQGHGRVDRGQGGSANPCLRGRQRREFRRRPRRQEIAGAHLRVRRPLMAGRQHHMVECLVRHEPQMRRDRQSYAVRHIRGVDDATGRAHLDAGARRPGVAHQGGELVGEIAAQNHARQEGPRIDLMRRDAHGRQVSRGLTFQPVQKRLLHGRDFDAGDIGQHRRVVPTGPIGRAHARCLLLFEDGDVDIRAAFGEQGGQGVDRRRPGSDKGDGWRHPP